MERRDGSRRRDTLPYKRAALFGLHTIKRYISRTVITVILLAVCFAAFGVCSGTFFSYRKKQMEIFYGVAETYHSAAVPVEKGDYGTRSEQRESLFSMSEGYAYQFQYKDAYFTQEEIQAVQEKLGLDTADMGIVLSCARGTRGASDVVLDDTFQDSLITSYAQEYYLKGLNYSGISARENLFYADYDRLAAAEMYNDTLIKTGSPPETSYYAAYRASLEESYDAGGCHFNGSYYGGWQAFCYLPEESLEDFGCTLLAGEMPRAADEIAINECWLEMFLEHGYVLYSDVAEGELFTWSVNYPGGENYDMEKPTGYLLNADGLTVAVQKEITCAEDMIGLQVALYGDLAMGDAFSTSDFYLVTITGVVDTDCHAEESGYYCDDVFPASRTQDKIFVSESWVDIMLDSANFALLFPFPAEKAGVEKLIALEQELIDVISNAEIGTSLKGLIGLGSGYLELLSFSMTMETEFYQIRILFAAGAVFTGIFAVLLCYHLISVSVEGNRREIGILRSLGAGGGDIRKIYLTECVLVGLAVFVLALCGAVGIVYGWLNLSIAGIKIMEIGAVQIAVLFLLCVGTPVLLGLACLKSFSKYSPVQLIAENFTRKKRRWNRAGSR